MNSTYYPQLVDSPDKDRKYLWEVNTHGQVVVRPVGADGRPDGPFAAGDAVEVLGLLAAVVSPRLEVKDYRGYDHPYHVVPGADTWAEACAVLNGKASARRAVGRSVLWLMRWCREYLEPERGGRWMDPPFALTEKARAWDAARPAERTPARSPAGGEG